MKIVLFESSNLTYIPKWTTTTIRCVEVYYYNAINLSSGEGEGGGTTGGFTATMNELAESKREHAEGERNQTNGRLSEIASGRAMWLNEC